MICDVVHIVIINQRISATKTPQCIRNIIEDTMMTGSISLKALTRERNWFIYKANGNLGEIYFNLPGANSAGVEFHFSKHFNASSMRKSEVSSVVFGIIFHGRCSQLSIWKWKGKQKKMCILKSFLLLPSDGCSCSYASQTVLKRKQRIKLPIKESFRKVKYRVIKFYYSINAIPIDPEISKRRLVYTGNSMDIPGMWHKWWAFVDGWIRMLQLQVHSCCSMHVASETSPSPTPWKRKQGRCYSSAWLESSIGDWLECKMQFNLLCIEQERIKSMFIIKSLQTLLTQK